MTAAVRRHRWRGAWILSTRGSRSGASLRSPAQELGGGGDGAPDLGRLVSLETWVSFPTSGVVAFLPVETTWVGQGYLPYRCIQMSRRVSRGQLSPRFSGPGK